ncbi:hypothetical protein B0J15DRAFT_158950 [Fusarium solani]|uniref:2EXR domain-containing protein n=1 Tax=Fusarium solani TaxID=169388 RepID=A0A9P9G4N5_FUSSL|nr:uncharacterized protein B0J15DRAFT_158950 [Fusarium solani]KAH7232473.1 hypothetical protein B0J15DRAFT_158950 [Fusarium solani]
MPVRTRSQAALVRANRESEPPRFLDFQRLPAELRLAIWSCAEALPRPQIHRATQRRCSHASVYSGQTHIRSPPLPLAFQICRETRTFALQRTQRFARANRDCQCLSLDKSGDEETPYGYFSPDVDVLHLAKSNFGWWGMDADIPFTAISMSGMVSEYSELHRRFLQTVALLEKCARMPRLLLVTQCQQLEEEWNDDTTCRQCLSRNEFVPLSFNDPSFKRLKRRRRCLRDAIGPATQIELVRLARYCDCLSG